jgi:hypothetical protein
MVGRKIIGIGSKGSGRGLQEVTPQNLPGGTEESYQNVGQVSRRPGLDSN